MQTPSVIANSNVIAPAPGFSGPISPILLRSGDGKTVEFRPGADITAQETALVMVMLLKLTLSREVIPPDWKGYIEQHGLGRHFADVG